MVASQRVRAPRSLNSSAASGAGARRQGAGSVTRPAPGRYFSRLAERNRFAEVVGKALSHGRPKSAGRGTGTRESWRQQLYPR